VLAVAASALLFAWWAGVASAAPGTIEVCKDAVAGDQVAGVDFFFSITKGTGTVVTNNLKVTGGGCSGPIATPSTGNFTVAEDLSSGKYMMTGATVNGGSIVRTNVAAGKVTVAVGPATAGETQVHITNALVGATVKVCKTTNEPAFLNKEYSFTIAGVPVVATSGATKGVPGACSQAIAIQPGSRINVFESVPPQQQVANVKGDNTTIRSQTLVTAPTGSTNGSYKVAITVKTNANVLTFDDEPIGPTQRGTLEICKSSGGDPFISGSYSFTVTDSTGAVIPATAPLTIPVGQCSGPIDVAAGNVNVAEVNPPDHTFVAGITVSGTGQLGPFNLANGTATVVVPVNPGDTLVTFINNATTASLKVCKFLVPGSGVLAGTTFNFSVSSPGIPSGPGSTGAPITVPVIATASGTGACTIVTATGGPVTSANPPLSFPVGSTASAVEQLGGPNGFGGYVTSGSPGDTGTTTIASGINMISVTNTALGQLEICKFLVASDSEYTGFTFTFTYKNTDATVTDPRASGTLTAAAGRCSPPVLVPVGTYQVTEQLSQTTTIGGTPEPRAFSFVSSTATGPTGDNRCSPVNNSSNPNCGNPITVTVPYFNRLKDPVLYGETTVAFTDRVNRTTIKICKYVESGSTTPLNPLSFTFNVFANGSPIPGSGTLLTTVTPGTCTGLLGGTGFPVITPGGTPTQLAVEEQWNGPYRPVPVTGMSVDAAPFTYPCSPPTAPAGTRSNFTVCWSPVVGNNVVSVTNMSGPAPL